jgi:uncharacterized protein YegP (UPF0339 family)
MDYRKTINIVKRYAELRKNKKSAFHFLFDAENLFIIIDVVLN